MHTVKGEELRRCNGTRRTKQIRINKNREKEVVADRIRKRRKKNKKHP